MKTDTLKIKQELLALITEITEIDEFKGAWRAFGTLAPERLNALRQLLLLKVLDLLRVLKEAN
ncbi:hypothetical protein [Bartonella senegalensis]|uniref:hypothetical protein n=1 Tax=Bartonella senegalensis TaxID=1468418 RepID=UPI0002FA5069|nr:hypothetical protein [Bartonella senegalensis]